MLSGSVLNPVFIVRETLRYVSSSVNVTVVDSPARSELRYCPLSANVSAYIYLAIEGKGLAVVGFHDGSFDKWICRIELMENGFLVSSHIAKAVDLFLGFIERPLLYLFQGHTVAPELEYVQKTLNSLNDMTFTNAIKQLLAHLYRELQGDVTSVYYQYVDNWMRAIKEAALNRNVTEQEIESLFNNLRAAVEIAS